MTDGPAISATTRSRPVREPSAARPQASWTPTITHGPGACTSCCARPAATSPNTRTRRSPSGRSGPCANATARSSPREERSCPNRHHAPAGAGASPSPTPRTCLETRNRSAALRPRPDVPFTNNRADAMHGASRRSPAASEQPDTPPPTAASPATCSPWPTRAQSPHRRADRPRRRSRITVIQGGGRVVTGYARDQCRRTRPRARATGARRRLHRFHGSMVRGSSVIASDRPLPGRRGSTGTPQT